MTRLVGVDREAQVARCVTEAKNSLGTRSIGVGYYVPDEQVLMRLAELPPNSMINVTDRLSGKNAPCAMTLIDFSLAA